MKRLRRHGWKLALFTAALIVGLLVVQTWRDMAPVGSSLHAVISDAQTVQVVDRLGRPLSVSYQNRWNSFDTLALHQIPEFLKTAFLFSEDRRFFEHGGVDWRARAGAMWQNLRLGRTVRGASTITEQVARMLKPRSRGLWSKWLETFEAFSIERHFSKSDILEFYFNQMPYASNRRGLYQAARYYFNRDLSTLSKKEMLVLVVLARAPSGYDLHKNPQKISSAIQRLAQMMVQEKLLTAAELADIEQEPFSLEMPQLPVNAVHFVGYVREHGGLETQKNDDVLKTTLDGALQRDLQSILDERLKTLSAKSIHNGAAVVVDHVSGEILAWVVAGAENPATPGRQIDAVTSPRQPGSALKPFLYAAALESGWSPATIIEDAPLAGAVGTGLHNFKNYSNTYYGKVTLREALANSLNIPALHAIRHVGADRYLGILRGLGFESLTQTAAIYDDGLALGNGEVTLFELAQAYTALANRGMFRPLRFLSESQSPFSAKRVFSEEATSLIANILSDPWARRLEFSSNSILNFPVQTAAKTGTSNDYRDAWAVGFNHRYVAAIWMGNLDQTPTNGVTGSVGPALALRSMFAKLNLRDTTRGLYLSPRLIKRDICGDARDTQKSCRMRSEYFIAGTEPGEAEKIVTRDQLHLGQPSQGLQIALDPRIPADRQKFQFIMSGMRQGDRVKWILNGQELAQSSGKYLWDLQRGQHRLQAIVVQAGNQTINIPEVEFVVK